MRTSSTIRISLAGLMLFTACRMEQSVENRRRLGGGSSASNAENAAGSDSAVAEGELIVNGDGFALTIPLPRLVTALPGVQLSSDTLAQFQLVPRLAKPAQVDCVGPKSDSNFRLIVFVSEVSGGAVSLQGTDLVANCADGVRIELSLKMAGTYNVQALFLTDPPAMGLAQGQQSFLVMAGEVSGVSPLVPKPYKLQMQRGDQMGGEGQVIISGIFPPIEGSPRKGTLTCEFPNAADSGSNSGNTAAPADSICAVYVPIVGRDQPAPNRPGDAMALMGDQAETSTPVTPESPNNQPVDQPSVQQERLLAGSCSTKGSTNNSCRLSVLLPKASVSPGMGLSQPLPPSLTFLVETVCGSHGASRKVTFQGNSATASVQLPACPRLPVVKSIRIEGTQSPLLEGGLARQLKAIMSPDDVDVTERVDWSVNEGGVSAITNAAGQKGLLTGLKPGKAAVNCTLDGVNCTKAVVTVTPAQILSIRFAASCPTEAEVNVLANSSECPSQFGIACAASPAGGNRIKLGETIQAPTVLAWYNNCQEKPLQKEVVIYHSSSAAAVTVDGANLVGAGEGAADISATLKDNDKVKTKEPAHFMVVPPMPFAFAFAGDEPSTGGSDPGCNVVVQKGTSSGPQVSGHQLQVLAYYPAAPSEAKGDCKTEDVTSKAEFKLDPSDYATLSTVTHGYLAFSNSTDLPQKVVVQATLPSSDEQRPGFIARTVVSVPSAGSSPQESKRYVFVSGKFVPGNFASMSPDKTADGLCSYLGEMIPESGGVSLAKLKWQALVAIGRGKAVERLGIGREVNIYSAAEPDRVAFAAGALADDRIVKSVAEAYSNNLLLTEKGMEPMASSSSQGGRYWFGQAPLGMDFVPPEFADGQCSQWSSPESPWGYFIDVQNQRVARTECNNSSPVGIQAGLQVICISR